MKQKLGTIALRAVMPFLISVLIAATGCGPVTNSKSAGRQTSNLSSSNSLPRFAFGMSGTNALKDGQSLSGIVVIVIAPLSRRQHDISLYVDGELAASAVVPASATNGAALNLDTHEFPSGERLLSVSGFEENDSGELRVRLGGLLGKDVRHVPLQAIKVRFENASPQPKP